MNAFSRITRRLAYDTRGLTLARDTRGLTTVEYAIVLCLIAALAVGAWQKFGAVIRDYLEGATNAIDVELKKK